MHCYVSLFGLGIKSYVGLGFNSLTFVLFCCVFNWFGVHDKPKQTSPALFYSHRGNMCFKRAVFSFLKAAVIKQEHVIILGRWFHARCFAHKDICLARAFVRLLLLDLV